MRRLHSVLLHLLAVTSGVATMVAGAFRWLPVGVLAVVCMVLVVVMLPRQPRFVAAYCAGVGLALVLGVVVLANPGWDGCADEVDGHLVGYRCSEGPPTG